MIGAIIGFFRSLFGATEAVAEATKQRDGELNTPDQRANAEARQIQADKDRAAAEIANPDKTDLFKDVAP